MPVEKCRFLIILNFNNNLKQFKASFAVAAGPDPGRRQRLLQFLSVLSASDLLKSFTARELDFRQSRVKLITARLVVEPALVGVVAIK